MIAIRTEPSACKLAINTVATLSAQCVEGGTFWPALPGPPGVLARLTGTPHICERTTLWDCPSGGQGAPQGPLKVACQDFGDHVPSSVFVQPLPARIRRDRARARSCRQGRGRLSALQYRTDCPPERPTRAPADHTGGRGLHPRSTRRDSRGEPAGHPRAP